MKHKFKQKNKTKNNCQQKLKCTKKYNNFGEFTVVCIIFIFVPPCSTVRKKHSKINK